MLIELGYPKFKFVMKKILFLLLAVASTFMHSQESKYLPQISVTGQGKVSTSPDLAVLTLGVQSTGKEAQLVKKENDIILDKVLRFLKKWEGATTNVTTSQVRLYPIQDPLKKQTNYQASQTLTVTLTNFAYYDQLVVGLLEQGINQITSVEFNSSKIADLQAQARREAVLDAQKKANDFAAPLGQKIGKALSITDNSSGYFPPMMRALSLDSVLESESTLETLALGEINVIVNVNVTFVLD